MDEIAIEDVFAPEEIDATARAAFQCALRQHPAIPNASEKGAALRLQLVRNYAHAVAGAAPDRNRSNGGSNGDGQQAADQVEKETEVGLKPTKPSQATRLIALVDHQGGELFHTADGEPFMTIREDGHAEHWSLKHPRRYLQRLCYRATGNAPSSQGVQDALGVLQSRALFDGEEHPVFCRVAQHEGAIYLDLADDTWSAIEITPSAWKRVNNAPVRFRRARGMLALPEPASGGSIEELRPFVNVADERDWKLLIAWLLAAFRPSGPYPLLVLHGEQGAAKSTTARVLRALLDPSKPDLRAEPRDKRDLMIAATNGWIVAYDNLSYLPPWLSDALCRLSTGGGFATRELYTDMEEVLFDAQRPVIMTGIEELTTRADLMDRSLLLNLPNIGDDRRRDEQRFWQEFNGARPRLLGGLLTAIAGALAALPSVKLPRRPRLADFALWATAGEMALGWERGAFLAAYAGNRAGANEVTLEASRVAGEVIALIDEQGEWAGTASDLLDVLNKRVGDKVSRERMFPKNPRALSGTLQRLAPNLRAVNVSIERQRETGRKRTRLIVIRRIPDAEHEQTDQDSADANPNSSDAMRTMKPPIHAAGWQLDDADANTRTLFDASTAPTQEDRSHASKEGA